jgi:hypothetical protein
MPPLPMPPVPAVVAVPPAPDMPDDALPPLPADASPSLPAADALVRPPLPAAGFAPPVPIAVPPARPSGGVTFDCIRSAGAPPSSAAHPAKTTHSAIGPVIPDFIGTSPFTQEP